MATPQTIHDLGRFLDHHTRIDEETARALIRAAASGQPITLPDASDFAGEVLRGQLLSIFRAVAGDAVPVQAVTAAAPEAPAPKASSPSAMSLESRQIAFRAIAGPRLEAMADALAATTVSLDEGTRAIQTARDNLPPERRRTPTIEQRAEGQPEFGGDFTVATTGTDVARAGWAKAFAATERV